MSGCGGCQWSSDNRCALLYWLSSSPKSSITGAFRFCSSWRMPSLVACSKINCCCSRMLGMLISIVAPQKGKYKPALGDTDTDRVRRKAFPTRPVSRASLYVVIICCIIQFITYYKGRYPWPSPKSRFSKPPTSSPPLANPPPLPTCAKPLAAAASPPFLKP